MLKWTTPLMGVALLAGTASAATFYGNGNTGFGGPLGTGNLVMTDDGTTLNITFNAGASNNDYLVIYFDTVAGGLADTVGVDDHGDNNRGAISGDTGGSHVVFASGFAADYAISSPGAGAGSNFAGLWKVVTGGDNSLPYVNTANIGGSQSATTLSVALADLGVAPGGSFNFVATYAAGGGWLSNETVGSSLTSPGSNSGAGVNAGNDGVVTFIDSVAYTTVPEPGALSLLGLGALGLLRRRK